MSSVNITTGTLLEVATKLRLYSQEMSNVARSMEQKVRSMQSWSDARAQQFTQQTSLVCKGLLLNVDNFAQMANFLQMFAQRQEEIESGMKQRTSNI